ncbi:uncharacterized protein [Ptychodera flava]|uniref:uncharacterized protein isoform X2 n=1 Tax=Ptychodera flava TaxID=63121 RepID=UPI00396A4932
MLVTDFKANVDIRDCNGKKPKHYLKKNTPNYIQQMLQGNVVYTVRKRQHRSNSMEKKRASVSFFNKPLKWGSAENLSQNKKEKTPPATPPHSPALRRGSEPGAVDKELMPPPKAPSKRSRRKKESVSGSRDSEHRRSQSDPDLLVQ